jgi:hypothetical protein
MNTDKGKAMLEEAEAEGWKQFKTNPIVVLAYMSLPSNLRPIIDVICKLAVMTGALAAADSITRILQQEKEKH